MDHHVVLWADRAEQCDSSDNSTLSVLIHGIGSSENVTCALSDTISASLGAFSYSGVAKLRGTGSHTSRIDPNKRSFEWAWNSCDAPYLYWFWHGERTAALPSYDWYWVMEWDCAWTGNLPLMLASFHGISAGAPTAAVNVDMLGHVLQMATRMYPHQNKVNWSFYKHQDKWWSSNQLMRFSRKLLLEVLRTLEEPTAFCFCELRLPSTCARLERESHKKNSTQQLGCSMASLQAALPVTSAGMFGSSKRDNIDGFSNLMEVGFETLPFEHLANEQIPGRFYHKFKFRHLKNLTAKERVPV